MELDSGGVITRDGGTGVRMRNFASQNSCAPGQRRGFASGSGLGLSVGNRPSKLSKYGVSFQPPDDDAVHYPDDARQMRFFEKVVLSK